MSMIEMTVRLPGMPPLPGEKWLVGPITTRVQTRVARLAGDTIESMATRGLQRLIAHGRIGDATLISARVVR